MMFPLAAALNFFSVTGLLIIAGLFGKEAFAADIAITQGAILAVFLSLSGNGRNLILSDKGNDEETNLFYFRAVICLPATALACLLVTSVTEVPSYLIVGLLLRKSSEWFADINLASKEKKQEVHFAFMYLLINGILLFSLVTALIFAPEQIFHFILYLWASAPLISVGWFKREVPDLGTLRAAFQAYISHIGSSSIIGVTTYVFRALVILLAGKMMAGLAFTAYALGGLVSAIYTYALGPTLALQNKSNIWKTVVAFSASFSLFGVTLILASRVIDLSLYPPLFIDAVGISIIGGGVMLLAQHKRIHLLQVCQQDVFVPDALANILFLSAIPFAFYIFGDTSVRFYFLWSALLNLMFYWVLSHKKQSIKT